MASPSNRSDAIHDALADTYGYEFDQDLAGRLKYELVKRRLSSGDRLIDVGCANGLHLRLHAPRSSGAVGIDLNTRMLDLAREKLAQDGIRNAELVQASATDLPFGDGEFDVAYSFSTLLLIAESDAAVREIARVVTGGGFTILDLTGRFNLSQRHWRRWYREQGHFGLSAYRLRDALRLHRDCGLEPLEIHATGLTDQWKYLRGAHRLSALERRLHAPDAGRDLDYRVSNVFGLRGLANRWYIVARKRTNA